MDNKDKRQYLKDNGWYNWYSEDAWKHKDWDNKYDHYLLTDAAYELATQTTPNQNKSEDKTDE